MSNLRQRLPILVYAIVAIGVLLPLLSRGYILTLDMVFAPHIRWPNSITNAYVLQVFLHAASLVLPGDIVEKLLLLAIFWLAGYGAHRLVVRSAATGRSHHVAAYCAGLVYAINPYVYDRFMAGQYYVLLGYALLPWFVESLLAFIQRPNRRMSLWLAIWAVVVSAASIHALGFMLVFAVVAVGGKLWQLRNQRHAVARLVGLGTLSAVIWLLLSSYWLLPLLQGTSRTASTLASFTAADQAAFITDGGSVVGRLAEVARLQGFWAEGQGLYILPQDYLPAWGLLTLLIWILVVTGAVSYWREHQRYMVCLFGVSGLLAGLLAAGVGSSWLVHLPYFAGYREPQKFAAVLALTYAVLAARGVSAVLTVMQRRATGIGYRLSGVAALALPLTWTPTMYGGFDGQLAPVQYPAGWYAVNRRLDADPDNFQVLFLPWHLYMYYNFAGRLIVNPAPQFFDKSIVSSNDPEFRNIPVVPDIVDSRAGQLLAAAPSRQDFGDRLVTLDVKYIIVDHDGDYSQYAWLNRQTGIKLVSSNNSVDLYRNLAVGSTR